MNPILGSIIIGFGLVLFFLNLYQKTKLILAGEGDIKLDRIKERIKEVLVFTFELFKIPRFQWIRFPRLVVFWVTLVFFLEIILVWGRTFSPTFNLWIMGGIGSENWLGKFYYFNRDLSVSLMLIVVLVTLFLKIFFPKDERFSLKEGKIWILGLLLLVVDLFYNGSMLLVEGISDGRWFNFLALFISKFILGGCDLTSVYTLNITSYWLLLIGSVIFLNLISRDHFHIFTVIVNVFFKKLPPYGKIPMIKELEEKLEALKEGDFIGGGNIEKFTWKDYLDWISCGEFGYCSENCPANLTGKDLDPKKLTIAMREHLFKEGKNILKKEEGISYTPPELFPEIIKPEVVWACTTCRACEEACPGRIGYVDKIIKMRQALVMDKGELPIELANGLRGVEMNGNPWNITPMDRGKWAEDLNIPLMKDKGRAEFLFWVGCAASYDERLKKIARALALLLREAKVDFAILGEEERCSGDIARRTGEELLFQNIAKNNIELLTRYNVKKIITLCPHCYNTLKYEYSELGGDYEVVHHSVFLNLLIKEGRLKIKEELKGQVTYHDSCYLGRYNNIYEEPREILKKIGLELVEVKYFSREKGMCCGGGGGQYFKEEEKGKERINYRRTSDLIETGAPLLATACPFCLCMITDGVKAKDKEEEIQVMDVAEILAKACGIEYRKPLS